MVGIINGHTEWWSALRLFVILVQHRIGQVAQMRQCSQLANAVVRNKGAAFRKGAMLQGLCLIKEVCPKIREVAQKTPVE
jgi:hypothetical protein